MAGEWIKLRTNLWDDPRVARLCDLTDQPEAMVIGGLYWLWAMADEHTEDGLLPGLTLRAIDRKTGIAGLGAALVQVGWLEDSEQGVKVVNFSEHNGESAKRRAADAKRKAGVRKMSARDADKTRTEAGQAPEENRTVCGAREEKNKSSLSDAGAPDDDLPPSGPCKIFLDWEPDPRLLKTYALRAGVPLDAFTHEAVAPFVMHHHARGAIKPQAEWVSALVRWVLNDRRRDAGRVVPLRGAGPAAPVGDWAEQEIVL